MTSTKRDRPPHPLEVQAEAMSMALFGTSARALDKARFEQLIVFWRGHRYWKPGDPVGEDADAVRVARRTRAPRRDGS